VYYVIKRLYPSQPVVGVGVVIVQPEKILLVKRRNEPEIGKWTIPGGVVEIGESTEQAVIRETKEETGLNVSNPTLFDVVNIIEYDTQSKVMYQFVIIDYLVTVDARLVPVAGSDVTELRWVPITEVENYDLTKSFRYFFQKNRQRLEQASFALKK
jgi:8-oxo-dGTP diphosphatase